MTIDKQIIPLIDVAKPELMEITNPSRAKERAVIPTVVGANNKKQKEATATMSKMPATTMRIFPALAKFSR